MSNVDVRPVETKQDRLEFIRLAHKIYEGDPNFVAPLEFEIGPRLDPKKNPGLKDSPHKLWIAYKNGAPAGRISAMVNHAHLDYHKDGAGHFGFIEMIDDESVADALITTASDWLKTYGMEKSRRAVQFLRQRRMRPSGRRLRHATLRYDASWKALLRWAS